MSDHLFWLTEKQFTRLKPLFPDKVRDGPCLDDYRMISAIVNALESGCRWVDAPPDYGPQKTLYNRFVRWAQKGVWRDVFVALADAGGPPSQEIIDSSAVRAHRSAAGRKGGEDARHWPLARRPDDENPCHHGSPPPPNQIHPDGWTRSRLRGCRSTPWDAAVANQRGTRPQGL